MWMLTKNGMDCFALLAMTGVYSFVHRAEGGYGIRPYIA